MKRKKKVEKENLSRKVEVDISGGIEQSSIPTIFAFSNHFDSTIVFSPSVKKLAFKYFRLRKRGRFYFHFYIAGLTILLAPFFNKLLLIKLDREFAGQEAEIKNALIQKFQGINFELKPDMINFVEIGRKSPAHTKAYKVFTKKAAPDKSIKFEELKKLL